MSESVGRSILKLREALEEGVQHTNPAVLAKKLENYEAKKEHYGPAIQQVLGIIDRAVESRLTVNGEILRLQVDMRRKWRELEANIKGMDFAVEQLQVSKIHHQLRDSISSILSEQRSVTSSMLDTPGSSPASSVVLLSRQSSEQGVSTPHVKSRTGSFASSTTARSATGKRLSSLPTSLGSSQTGIPRKTPLSRSSVAELRPGVSSRLYSTPTPSRSFSRTELRTESKPDKPRWNNSTNLKDTPLGHNFKPISATTPSPYKKATPSSLSPRSVSSPHTAKPSPLGPNISSSTSGLRPPSALASSRTPLASSSGMPRPRTQQSTSALRATRPGATPVSQPTKPLLSQKSVSHLPRASTYGSLASTAGVYGTPTSSYAQSNSSSTSTATLTNHSRHTSAALSTLDDESPAEDVTTTRGEAEESSPTIRLPKARPTTSMAGKRVSMLPQPKRAVSSQSDAVAAATAAMGSRSVSGIGTGRRTSMGFGSNNIHEDGRLNWK